MSKILLIEADEYNELIIPGIEKPTPLDIVQPLGLMLLAALLRENNPARKIKIIDTRLFKKDYSSMAGIVTDFAPDIIGIRTVSKAFPYVRKLLKELRELCPNSIMILGGPHASSSKEHAMEEENINFIIYGEGDRSFPQLVTCIEEKKDYRGINGLIYRENKEIKINPPQPFIEDLDALPFPAWDLIDLDPYFDAIYNPHSPIYFNARREIASIFTSRGCPYNCNFCHNIFGKRVRFQSPEKVLSEMKRMYEDFGIRQFDFRDDIFNVNKKRAIEICDMIIKSGMDVNLTFPNGLRGDIIDEELILKLKEAGTTNITYALETASDRIQKMIKKNIDSKKLKKAIDFTSSLGIIVRVFVMMGFPTETREEMLATAEYVLNPSIDTAVFHVVNPFEGTEIYNEVKKEGIDPSEFKDKYNYISPNFSTTSEVPYDDFRKIYYETVMRFFNDEKRISRSYDKWVAFHRPSEGFWEKV